MANDMLGKATTDPEYLALQAALGTAGAMLMAIKATEEGQPALAGVDSMLTALFVRYRAREPHTIANAGHIVADEMRQRGFVEIGKAKCPVGCSAVTGAMFRLPTPIAH